LSSPALELLAVEAVTLPGDDSVLPIRYAHLFAYGAEMRAVRHQVEQAAATEVAVLVRGEPGVGKDRVARALHTASPRWGGPFVRAHCGAVPADVLDGELFGYEARAFPGAGQRRRGKIELAHRGTLMLDEVGDLPLSVQAKLFRFLQDAEVTPLGSAEAVKVDVRVVAVTNRKLEAAVRRGEFREDLFYRLNVVVIEVPPLRERRQEIPILTRLFLRRFNLELGRSVALHPDTMRLLETHDWPGNVRELMHLIRRLVALDRAVVVREDFVPDADPPDPDPFVGAPVPAAGGAPGAVSLKQIARRAARDAEREVIRGALERSQGNRAQAARLLRISYKALLYKMAQCGLGGKVVR
jgi:two-component system, NtrC family, response regulator AtoC